jgi:Tfp pilus assembly protein PilV
MNKRKEHFHRKSAEAGMTLLETLIALAILFVVSAGLMGMGVIAAVATENQGHLSTRTTEYAQDKMEQLMSLKFGDIVTDTISPECVMYLIDSVCWDAARGEKGLAIGGDLNFDSADNHYVDYLDIRGNPLGGGVNAPPSWYYMRVWKIDDITTDATLPANLKRISVSCKTKSTVEQRSGLRLAATVTSLKSSGL